MTAGGDEILGRDEELLSLERFLHAVPEGPSALLIRGRPGIGKTTVWLKGIEFANASGYRLLSSRSVESEARMSFTTLGDLLGEVIDDTREDLPVPQRDAIDAALLRTGDMRPDRRAVSLATTALLQVLSRSGPVVLAIDDIQWVDPASAKILSFALRRLGHEPIAVLATLRDDVGTHDPVGLARAFEEPALKMMELAGLDEKSLGQLVRERLHAGFPHTVAARIHSASEGDPFFALEIGRALLKQGRLPEPGEPLPVPDDLGALLRARLRALPAGARDALLLASAAVHPSVELIRIAGDGPGDPSLALAAAADARVIEIVRDDIHFTHPLLASSVYADAMLHERRSAHARLARVVEEEEERVRHLALSASGPDEAVAAALDGAARAAFARGAPDSAIELQELALKLTPIEDERSKRRREMGAATYSYAAGDTRAAHERLERTIAVTPAGSDRAELRFELSRMLWNDIDRIRRLLEQAAEDAGEHAPPELLAQIEVDMSWVVQFGGDLAQASRHGGRALELAELIGDPSLLAWVLASLAYGGFLMGRPTQALLDRAVALQETAGPEPVRIVSARRVRGATLMWAGYLDEARRILDLDHQETVRLGGLSYQWEELVYLAELELRAGNWDLAAAYASEGLDSTVETGLEEAREVHLWSTALVAAHRGDVDVARAHATEGLAIAEAHGDVFHIVTNRSVLGFLELSLADPAGTHGWLEPLIELSERWGLGEPGAFPFMPDEIEALIALGELDAARALLDGLETQGEALDRAFALASAARCQALLASAAGDMSGAFAAIERSLSQHERLPQPFDLARTLLVAGRTHRRFKKKASARTYLERARDVFDGLGATLWSVMTREELARISGRSASRTELTETERQVAELVGEGKTNAEVAAHLFMSVNTVRSNLRRVYAKLGVRSRSELAHQYRTGEADQ